MDRRKGKEDINPANKPKGWPLFYFIFYFSFSLSFSFLLFFFSCSLQMLGKDMEQTVGDETLRCRWVYGIIHGLMNEIRKEWNCKVKRKEKKNNIKREINSRNVIKEIEIRHDILSIGIFFRIMAKILIHNKKTRYYDWKGVRQACERNGNGITSLLSETDEGCIPPHRRSVSTEVN